MTGLKQSKCLPYLSKGDSTQSPREPAYVQFQDANLQTCKRQDASSGVQSQGETHDLPIFTLCRQICLLAYQFSAEYVTRLNVVQPLHSMFYILVAENKVMVFSKALQRKVEKPSETLKSFLSSVAELDFNCLCVGVAITLNRF